METSSFDGEKIGVGVGKFHQTPHKSARSGNGVRRIVVRHHLNGDLQRIAREVRKTVAHVSFGWTTMPEFFGGRHSSDCKIRRSSHFVERVEMINVPGATTSGLKRPYMPSMPMPTLPRARKTGHLIICCVSRFHGCVWVVPIEICETILVIFRSPFQRANRNHVLCRGPAKQSSRPCRRRDPCRRRTRHSPPKTQTGPAASPAPPARHRAPPHHSWPPPGHRSGPPQKPLLFEISALVFAGCPCKVPSSHIAIIHR